MSDIQQMLKAIINGQHALKREVLEKIDKVDKNVDRLGERLEGKIDRVEKNLSDRIDKVGKQLAYLEDDTPNREEFDNLEKRVGKLEHKSNRTL